VTPSFFGAQLPISRQLPRASRGRERTECTSSRLRCNQLPTTPPDDIIFQPSSRTGNRCIPARGLLQDILLAGFELAGQDLAIYSLQPSSYPIMHAGTTFEALKFVILSLAAPVCFTLPPFSSCPTSGTFLWTADALLSCRNLQLSNTDAWTCKPVHGRVDSALARGVAIRATFWPEL
jgi:hypothetical protein